MEVCSHEGVQGGCLGLGSGEVTAGLEARAVSSSAGGPPARFSGIGRIGITA